MTTIASIGPMTMKVADTVAIPANRLITMAATGLATLGTTTSDIYGVSEHVVPAATADRLSTGDAVTVAPLNRSGMVRLTASAAIAVGAPLEKAASGKVATVSAGEAIGYAAIEAAAADGDIILAWPIV